MSDDNAEMRGSGKRDKAWKVSGVDDNYVTREWKTELRENEIKERKTEWQKMRCKEKQNRRQEKRKEKRIQEISIYKVSIREEIEQGTEERKIDTMKEKKEL